MNEKIKSIEINENKNFNLARELIVNINDLFLKNRSMSIKKQIEWKNYKLEIDSWIWLKWIKQEFTFLISDFFYNQYSRSIFKSPNKIIFTINIDWKWTINWEEISNEKIKDMLNFLKNFIN